MDQPEPEEGFLGDEDFAHGGGHEHIDEDYEPTDQEVLEYCEWLGMDVVHDRCLMWIAREALKAPLPENWKVCYTEEREAYYFNVRTGESIWDHPMDAYYKALYKQEKTALDKKRKKMRMFSGSLPILPLVEFFSERVLEDANTDTALMAKDRPWVSLPESLCDPIDYQLYHEPVVLPTSGRTVSRHTIINNRWRDPFSREYVENRRLVPNIDKRREVDQWLEMAVGKYFELVTGNAVGFARMLRLLPYLVDKDDEVSVKAQNMMYQWFLRNIATLHPISSQSQNNSATPGCGGGGGSASTGQTPRKTGEKKTSVKSSGAQGSAVTAVRSGSGRKQSQQRSQSPATTTTTTNVASVPVAPPQTLLNDILALSDEDCEKFLCALLTMSTTSSINSLLLLLSKIPQLGRNNAFRGFAPEVLHVLHVSNADLASIKSRMNIQQQPRSGDPDSTELPTIPKITVYGDDTLSLQWIATIAEMTPPVFLLSELDWNMGLSMFMAMTQSGAISVSLRANTLCQLALSLKGWPDMLNSVDEGTLLMFMDIGFQGSAENMVTVLHDACIHGGERLMEAVRMKRSALMGAIFELYQQDPSHTTNVTTLAHLGAVLVFHEVCKMDDFLATQTLALLIGQNLFPRLTRMQWRPKHFENTVSRLITMCTANPVLSSTVLKTSAADFLLKELGRKKRNNEDIRIKVDTIEADLRRLEQSNAINNWVLLTTGIKLQQTAASAITNMMLPLQGGSSSPPDSMKPIKQTSAGSVKKGSKIVAKERILPTLGKQPVPTTSENSDDDSDDDCDFGERLRQLLQKGIQKRTDIASERATHIVTILNMLLAMRLKAKPRGSEAPAPQGQKPVGPNTRRKETLTPNKDDNDVVKAETAGSCILPKI
eukprot:PhF_6_TR963/c0_g1_i3/m.1830